MKFKSQYNNDYVYDFDVKHNLIMPIYKVVPPYTKDPKTGKFLNDSSELKRVQTGSIDIDKDIQSYAKDVDLYSILEKFAVSGNTDLINRSMAQYGDISNVPDNIHDATKLFNSEAKNFEKLPNELKSKVIDESISNEELTKQFQEFMASKLIKNKVENKDESGDK